MYLYKSKSDLAGGDWWESRQQKLFDDITDNKISKELKSIINGLTELDDKFKKANISVIVAYVYEFKNYIKTTKDHVLRKDINTYIDTVLNKHVEALNDIDYVYNDIINNIPGQFKAEFSTLCNNFRKIFVGYCNITYDLMMIVGKYFETNRDFINLMKVCRSYNDIVSAYHFNPISDTSLFENMQTQVFYNKEDLRKNKSNMFDYRINYHIKPSKRRIGSLNKYKESLKKYETDTFMKRIINVVYSLGLHPFYLNGYSFGNIVFDSECESDIDLFDKPSALFAKLKPIYSFPLRLHIIVDEDCNVFGFCEEPEVYGNIAQKNDFICHYGIFKLMRSDKIDIGFYPVYALFTSLYRTYVEDANTIIEYGTNYKKDKSSPIIQVPIICMNRPNAYINNIKFNCKIDHNIKPLCGNLLEYTDLFDKKYLTPRNDALIKVKRYIIIDMKQNFYNFE